MSAPILTISIVHFNTSELTQHCIQSALKILDSSSLAKLFEISIVDNKSEVEDYKKLEGFVKNLNRDDVFIYRNCVNSGFGLGCMLSLNKSAAEYIAFINSDTFFKEDCFTPLIDFMRVNPSAGAITPQHMDGEGNAILSYSHFDTFGSRIFGNWLSRSSGKEQGAPSPSIAGSAQSVDFIFGSFMLVRRDAFSQVGGFDPNIFLYYEEMDLCFRLKNAGYSSHFFPGVSFFHLGNGSSGGVTEVLRLESLLSMIYVIRKHRGALYGFAFFLALLFQFALKAPFKSRNRRLLICLFKAAIPQACSHRLSQSCNFDVVNR